MERADGINESALHVCAGFFGDAHRNFEIADIIQGIEDADDANAIMDGPFDKFSHDIVSIVVVTENILTAQQHLDGGLGCMFFNDSQPFPWIFVQKPEGAVKRSSAPGFQRKIADIIQLFQHADHVGCAHPGGCQ